MLTPETLRELAGTEPVLPSDEYIVIERTKLLAAADEWEADIDEWRRAHDLMRDAYLDKCKRLEEAEATTERVRETGQALLDDANKRLEEAKEELAWRRGPRLQAALAPGEAKDAEP